MPLELHLLMLAATITASLLLMLQKGMVILRTLSRVAGSKRMITLVIRRKGCLTRSGLDMISRTMGHLAMGHQLLTQLRMVVLHRAMVVQVALVKQLQGSKLQLQPPILLLLHQATWRKVLPPQSGYTAPHSLTMICSHTTTGHVWPGCLWVASTCSEATFICSVWTGTAYSGWLWAVWIQSARLWCTTAFPWCTHC
ncbi:hypothetical protein VPH35_120768 [Triticum aestivum]